MADMVDRKLYEQLADKAPEDIVLEPFCRYDEAEKEYHVRAWGINYCVSPGSMRACRRDGGREPHAYFYVFLINYLLSRKRSAPAGEWISEKDLPGGSTFFRGPHAIPTDRLVGVFGNDLAQLGKKCEELGGSSIDMADSAFAFTVVGAVRVALLYWQGDEDFPPEAKLLVDSSLADLQLDITFALLCDVCDRIASN